jgi:hypothetical protein
MNDWEFNGAVNCDKCKFGKRCLSSEDKCPYLAGWQDGQAKMLKHFESKKNKLPKIHRAR